MKHLIRSVRMLNPDGVLSKKTTDILIEDGTVRAVGASLEAPRGTKVFEYPGAIASPGWLDSKANFREPGEEVKEG